jgi:prepilin-type N-terminal cleavage/methylation domain-containing protein
VKVHRQRGFTLLETTVAVAIICVAAGALLGAIGEFGRFATNQSGPVRASATMLAEQTLRVAENTWKYGSPGTSPSGSLQTTVPVLMPNGMATTAPVALQTRISSADATSAQIDVTVSYTPDADHAHDPGSVTLHGDVQVRSPRPASTVAPAPLIPQPSAAP